MSTSMLDTDLLQSVAMQCVAVAVNGNVQVYGRDYSNLTHAGKRIAPC